MIVNFTVAPTAYSQTWMAQTLDAIKRAFIPVVSKQEGVERVILRSKTPITGPIPPHFNLYELTVDDGGGTTATLSVTLLPGTKPGAPTP